MPRRIRYPGTVRSDVKAFRQISSRFQEEVGRILGKIDYVPGQVPYWSLIRMMFPVVESLGDLMYRRDRATAQNLRSVLDKEFEEVRTGYRRKSAILTLLYRHSLTHHDELQTIKSGGKEVGWMVTPFEDIHHLDIERDRKTGIFMIHFQPIRLFVPNPRKCKIS